MTTRALLLLKKRPARAPSEDAPLEWLVTNGLGGYAAGTVAGPPMRRFHGVLVAAQPAPIGRVMLLHALEETVALDGQQEFCLRSNKRGRPVLPYVDFFLQAGLPNWVFELAPDICLEQTVFLLHGQNTVHVRYRLSAPAPTTARLTVRPWLDIRPHEGALTPRQSRRYLCREHSPTDCECTLPEVGIGVKFRSTAHAVSFTIDADDWDGITYDIERTRGYDHVGSMHSPGLFDLVVSTERDAYLSASSEEWPHFNALSPEAAWDLEMTRRDQLLAASHPALLSADTFLLPLAADQFIVEPATRVAEQSQARAVGAEPRTVIAGYPWFTDWSRDTMISLEGLTLVTGRQREARDILRTFALHVKNGLIPNLFPEGERQGLYHTADATLWFFHALHRYDTVSGDHGLVQELLPVLEDIVEWHQRGTSFHIRVDADGLLAQGDEGLQLTWMDAKVDDWVVTPRRGKTVEINALWHNALILLGCWLARSGRGLLADGLAREARRCREAFNRRFWNARARRLYDVVDGDNGDDDACRPNQVIAIAVEHSPLDREHWEDVLESVTSELLTPHGLRTLSRAHRDYKARYFGNLRSRDAAYHQGTVWPWLMGPFIDAWLAVHPDDAEGARTLLAPLLQHLTCCGCVGSVSEIFDAESPFTPRGCFAQAWSVAELARTAVKLSVGVLNPQNTVESA